MAEKTFSVDEIKHLAEVIESETIIISQLFEKISDISSTISKTVSSEDNTLDAQWATIGNSFDSLGKAVFSNGKKLRERLMLYSNDVVKIEQKEHEALEKIATENMTKAESIDELI